MYHSSMLECVLTSSDFRSNSRYMYMIIMYRPYINHSVDFHDPLRHVLDTHINGPQRCLPSSLTFGKNLNVAIFYICLEITRCVINESHCKERKSIKLQSFWNPTNMVKRFDMNLLCELNRIFCK